MIWERNSHASARFRTWRCRPVSRYLVLAGRVPVPDMDLVRVTAASGHRHDHPAAAGHRDELLCRNCRGWYRGRTERDDGGDRRFSPGGAGVEFRCRALCLSCKGRCLYGSAALSQASRKRGIPGKTGREEPLFVSVDPDVAGSCRLSFGMGGIGVLEEGAHSPGRIGQIRRCHSSGRGVPE